MCFFSGYGAIHNERQIFIMNSDKQKDALFQLEYKIRYLVDDP